MEDTGPSEQIPMNESEDWVSVHHVATTETDSDVDGPLPASEELSPSETRASEEESHTTQANDLETIEGCAPANVAFSDSCSEQSNDNPPDMPTPEPIAASVGADARSDEESKHVPIPEDQISEAPAVTREWSQAECHMNTAAVLTMVNSGKDRVRWSGSKDIRYAEKSTPCIPHRVQKQQLKILVTGQPETGRTTAIKNLFASIAEDPDWCPTDVAGLTMSDFCATPERFTTTVSNRKDTGGHLSISYVIQETPGIKGEPTVAAQALANYMHTEHEAYADQEGKLNVPRDELKDGRVDCVLYFLPTNARIGESDLDFTVINALAAYAPVIPLMCKADCLEEEEILQRKSELERLREEGLKVYSFPEHVISKLTDAAHGLSRCEPPMDEPVVASASGPAFRPPFNIVAGTHADLTVHRFWFVRKYRWAECEAYRTSNSDLRLLRQLLLEDGFWCIKDAADACYREQCTIPVAPPAAAEAAAVETAPEVTTVNQETEHEHVAATESGQAEVVGTIGEIAAGELRQSGRGSRFVPAWLSPPEPAPKVTQPSPIYPLGVGAPSLREVVSTRGIGAAARPASRTATPTPNKPPAAPKHRTSLEGISQNLLSVSSEETEFNTITGAAAGASALAMLTSDNIAAHAEASPSSQLGSISNPLASSSTFLPPPAVSATSAAAAVAIAAEPDESGFDESTCVEATVQDVQRGMSRNYRLTLKLAGNEKQLCLRIGDTEGSSIAAALRNTASSRPSAYDATAELLKALKCKVERILITECTNTIFYARVYALNSSSGHHVNVDARPSDAINLALRHNAPVFVNKGVVKQFAK